MNKKIFCLALLPLLMCPGCNVNNNNIVVPGTDDNDDALKEFTNCKLENASFTYDGKFHQLLVVGAPEGTNVYYSNNTQKDVGVYEVTATLNKEGYKDKTFVAYLTISVELKQFTNCKMESQTITYDGNFHQLSVTGAPQGTTISYSSNNKQKEVGVYEITATLSKDGYENKELVATLTINKALNEFTGITFSSKTITYDGEVHSLVLTGAPEGANIKYTNNGKKEIGTYTVKAEVSMEGYKTKTYSATLTIKARRITGVTFKDASFKYDGNQHSIYVSGLPEGTTVAYSGNGKIYEGTYIVYATITGTGYEKLVLSATMTISDIKEFPDVEFDDFYYIYDDRDINVKLMFESYEYSITYNHTKYFDVVYKINGVKKDNPTIRNVGTYNVSATYTAEKFATKTISFKIIISDKIGGADLTKTPFQFNNDSKFADLYAEMMKGNYTVKVTYHDEYDYDKDGTFEDVEDSPNISYYYVTPEAFAGRHNEDSTLYKTSDYYITKDKNYAYRYDYEYCDLSKTKIPSSSYFETVLNISGGMAPFTLLKESATGGFENSKTGAFHDNNGSFNIDSVRNELRITSKNHYFKDEWDHDEVTEYTIYNVGNTTVTIPDNLKGNDSHANLFEVGEFVENGIEYSPIENGFKADVTLNEADDVYLGGGGVYTLRPEIEGIPVKEIYYDYYYYKCYVDHSKYTINVYYDNEGYYQGEYADYGFVKYYLDAKKFGLINYYKDWNK